MKRLVLFFCVTAALFGQAAAPGPASGGGGGFTSDATHNGAWYPQGFTSGGLAFSVADVAGTATTIIFPADTATATTGYTLSLGAVAACPAHLPTTVPATCRYLTWAATGLASQAADTALMNATGSSAAPTAVALPTTGTNGCDGSTDALRYNTSTHSYKCGQISAGSGNEILLHSAVNTSPVTCNGSAQTLATYTVGAATLSTGDSLEIVADFAKTGTAGTSVYSFTIGGTNIKAANYLPTAATADVQQIHIQVWVTGASTQNITGFTMMQNGGIYNMNSNGGPYTQNTAAAVSGTIVINAIQTCTASDTGKMLSWSIVHHNI